MCRDYEEFARDSLPDVLFRVSARNVAAFAANCLAFVPPEPFTEREEDLHFAIGVLAFPKKVSDVMSSSETSSRR
jgi:hypothetical protein